MKVLSRWLRKIIIKRAVTPIFYSLDNKRSAILESTPKILQLSNIDPKHWCYLSQNSESQFKSLVGTSYDRKQACEQLGKQWGHGIRAC
jgi:hypothetical protein